MAKLYELDEGLMDSSKHISLGHRRGQLPLRLNHGHVEHLMELVRRLEPFHKMSVRLGRRIQWQRLACLLPEVPRHVVPLRKGIQEHAKELEKIVEGIRNLESRQTATEADMQLNTKV